MDNRLFHLNDLAAEANLNDFQHSIERSIEQHGSEAGFPQMANYNIGREQLDDYLFDRQAILDTGGNKRSRYTVCGFLIILPVLVLSAVPETMRPFGEWAILFAVAVGLLLFGIYLAILKTVVSTRLHQLDKAQRDCANYVSDVQNFHVCCPR